MRVAALLTGVLLLCAGSCAPVVQEIRPDEYHEGLRLIDEGTLRLRAGELDEAEATFIAAAELAPLAAALDGRGCVAFLRGDLSAAERWFTAAWEMDRTYEHSLANLALVREAQGDQAGAERLYRAAITEEPRHFRARNNYAAFLVQMKGSTVEGRQELLKAAALADHPLIRQNLDQLGDQ